CFVAAARRTSARLPPSDLPAPKPTRFAMSLPAQNSDAPASAVASSSRREFMKTTGIVAAGAVAAELSIARSAHAAGSDMLKIGLVGCGGRGNGAALQALKADKNVKLVAMGDAFEDELEKSYKTLAGTNELGERVDVPKERRFSGFDAYKKV